jgi:hypothetical protein
VCVGVRPTKPEKVCLDGCVSSGIIANSTDGGLAENRRAGWKKEDK